MPVPTRLAAAWVSLLVGDDELMRRLVAETRPVAEASRYRTPGVGARESVVAIRAGLTEQRRSRHERNVPTRRVKAALLMLNGKFVGAADL